MTLSKTQKVWWKKGVDEQNQENRGPALFLCKTDSVTLDKDFHPLGFDFLACQGGAQHLSANLSGHRRSNKSKEMHFEEQSTLFGCKDDGHAASGKAFHLSVSLDPPSTRGAPRGAPSLHGLTAHLPSLPSPFTEGRV